MDEHPASTAPPFAALLKTLLGLQPPVPFACPEHFDADVRWEDSADPECFDCQLRLSYVLDRQVAFTAQRGIEQIEELLARTAEEPDRHSHDDNQKEEDLDE